jgi:1-acyl-sn-glycerol-3-phosphate acyltransferase
MKKKLYTYIFYKLMGWEITGRFPKELNKVVMIVVPHTSWHDFYIGLFVRGIVGLPMHFVAKKELFTFPFGYYFRWMGGASLDRSGGQNKVDAIASIFNRREVFRMAIAPEGTRKKVTRWRSGFYYIALQAEVPILPISFDWSLKTVHFHTVFQPAGDFDSDIKQLENNFKGVLGRFPEKSYTIE